MKNLDVIAKDLFNKIRGRFPNITIGDSEGNVTNIPDNARYFDFAFSDEKEKKISVSLDENNGVVVIVGKDIVSNQPEHVQDKWYSFLKELRIFAKKRLLNFDVRDINKSNLNKRDYKFLAATRPGDEPMAESRMYGTNKTSYQRIGNARLAIKHSQPINVESTGSRSQKIKAIYIESPEGERFKYPFKHIAGARAMARHVSEGGNAYDDFGKYIAGLSEEASKLQKFKKYMGRSTVMAETLSSYMDTVNTRIQEVKKEIIHLQKESFYKEAVSNFTVSVVEDVPEDVAENWIDQLTIKQFNEELKDVFPYIYKLVGEATKAKDLGPDDLIDESGLQYYTGVKKHGKEYMKKAAQAGREGASQEELGRLKDKYSKAEKKTKEEFEIEQAFEDVMGQFSDHVCEDCGNPSWRTLSEEKQKGVDGKVCWKGYKRMGTKMKGGKRVDNCVKVSEANDYNFSPDDLQQLQKIGNVDAIKRKAIELISTKSNKPMDPKKVEWFKRQIDSKRTPIDVIKLMYDLLQAGEGNAVIGSKGSMSSNSYRRRFGESTLSIDNIRTVMQINGAQAKRWDSTIRIPGMKWNLDNQAYIKIGQMIQSGKDASSLIQQEIQKIKKLQNFIKQNSVDPKNPVHKAVMSLLQQPSILKALDEMVRLLSQSGNASEATTDQFAERIAPAIKDRYRTDKNWTAADNNYNGFIIYVSKDKIANGMHVATAVSAATAREVEGVKTGANKAQKAVELIKQKLDARISSAKKVTADATLDFNVKFMQELSQDLFELGYDEGQAFYAKISPGPVLVIANLDEFAGMEELLRSEGFSITGNRGKAGGNVMPSLRITAKKMQATDLVANGRYIIGNPEKDSDGHYVYSLQFDSIVNDKGDLLKFNKPAVTVGANRNESVDEGLGKKLAMLALLGLTGYGAMKATSPVNSPLGQALQTAAEQGDKDAAYHLKRLGAYIDAGDSGTLKQLNFQYIDEPAAMKDDSVVPNDSVSSPLSMSPKKSQTPLGEFILSYFDRETGKFPKGETAVLTAVQKDYGDQYVKPAVEFIKKVEAISTKNKMEKIQSSSHPETEMIKHLAGV